MPECCGGIHSGGGDTKVAGQNHKFLLLSLLFLSALYNTDCVALSFINMQRKQGSLINQCYLPGMLFTVAYS